MGAPRGKIMLTAGWGCEPGNEVMAGGSKCRSKARPNEDGLG